MPANNALEQTVGAKRTLDAPPAAQRGRSADEKRERTMARCLLATKAGPAVAAVWMISAAGTSLAADTRPADDLYVLALRAAIEQGAHAQGESLAKEIVVEQLPDLIDSFPPLPAVADGYKVVLLDRAGLLARFRQTGRFRVSVVRPMRNDGDGRLVVPILTYWFSHRGGNVFRHARVMYELEGGTNVSFTYDCAVGRFVVEKVSGWGV